MKTKLLKEYLRLRNRPRFETGVNSFIRHKILATFALFPDTTVDKKNVFYHCKTVSFLPKCVYSVQTMFVCACWTKQLTPPPPHTHTLTFSQYIWVKPKLHGFSKWMRIFLRIICTSLLTLSSDDCWGNAIWHVFQTAILDDSTVDQRLAIERDSSS